ncbi:MAG: alcohol dehydrogenase catalytic domain-containing protein [Bryobacterales bacterium]|nr:alcohol dehydrogenase catalytic domain-containing protein [Bryobacterales bacterium]
MPDSNSPTMRAAVYRGQSQVLVEEIPVPAIGPGELLVRVESCGICHTDLKKVEYDLLPPPRIYGHETAGVVAAVGAGVTKFKPGDRVVAFHHIPCGACFYCERRLYAQCAVYKKVGITAGFEPAGGGFAQYIRIMDWIVERGVEIIPDGVPFDTASFVEPVNTCVKAVWMADPKPGDLAVVIGQGPIGLIFTMLLKHKGIRTLGVDTMAERRALSEHFGAERALDPRSVDLAAECAALTDGRGADMVFVAVSAPGVVEQAIRATRAGAKILLFAQTSDKERIELSGKDICMGERIIFGSYSADVDLQRVSADLVFSGAIPVGELVTHRFGLDEIAKGFDMALHPTAESLKIVVRPQGNYQ